MDNYIHDCHSQKGNRAGQLHIHVNFCKSKQNIGDHDSKMYTFKFIYKDLEKKL